MTRQQKWQKKKIEAGLCSICGNEPLLSTNRCKVCLIKNRVHNRHINGNKAREITGLGRPTID